MILHTRRYGQCQKENAEDMQVFFEHDGYIDAVEVRFVAEKSYNFSM